MHHIEENIGYVFTDKGLIERALTRKAYALEQRHRNNECDDQEIYRTLGDAVLKLILVDLLIDSGATSRDEITSRKKTLERESMLAHIGEKFGIGKFIKMGAGEKKQKAQEEPKVLAETLEAVVGAIYLDGGYEVSKTTITHWFKDVLTQSPSYF